MNREKEFPGASIIPTFRTTKQQMYLSFRVFFQRPRIPSTTDLNVCNAAN